jgi:porphobilinogen synthase
MPGVERVSVDLLVKRVAGLKVAVLLLFGVPEVEEKDEEGSSGISEDGIVPSAIRALKAERPEIALITDVCLCAYTNHGHCGMLTDSGEVDNDKSLNLLCRMAEVHAAAGADIVAPSAMMDGQVRAIRERLDASGFSHTAIMSYAAKFASSFYGPFRDAARSAPSFGDRRSYQLPPANRREALREALLDEKEGADWLMVKPALPYLDVITELHSATLLAIAAYQVSGEYAMLKFASQAEALEEKSAVMESIMCIKRAGADAIITYYAEEVCKWISR